MLINVVAINAIKYFNTVKATLFTSGARSLPTRKRRMLLIRETKTVVEGSVLHEVK